MRAQRRQVNRNVMYDVRLANFTNPHIRVGDLHVDRNQTIGGNLDVSGNLTIDGDIRARNYYASGNYYLDNYVLIPAGTIIQSAAIDEPEGWFDCNGQTLSVVEFAYLFDAIGYTYGGADLSFNIPDMRGRVGIGLGDGDGTALSPRNLGVTGGEEKHKLDVTEMPRHNHTGNTGTTTGANNNATSAGVGGLAGSHDVADDGSHSHTIEFEGGNGAHNNMQPFLVLRYLIKY